jgi:hypothetical protein
MAVRIQLRRDTAANWVSSNPTLRAGEIGIETDTLKFKVGNGSSPWNSITAYANVVPSDLNTTLNGYLEVGDLSNTVAELVDGELYLPGTDIIFEGTTNSHEFTLTAPDVTEDKTVTLPNATTTLVGTDTTDTLTNKTLTSPVVSGLTLSDSSIVFEGAVADSYETTLTVGEPTADRTITLPDVTGTVVTTGDTGSVTNAMLAGSIANDKLSNSSVTINGYSISLGASATYGTDNISEGTTNLYFTNERAQDAVATALSNGTHTNITVAYDDNANSISLTGAQTYSDENAQDAVGNAVGNGLDYDDSTGAISVDPSEFALSAVGSPTADVNMASYKITSLAAPTSANDAATKAYVDNTTAGLNFHAAVHAATTANLDATYNNGTSGVGATLTANANGALVVDGHTLNADERVLVKNQTAGLQNGIYVVTATGDGSNPWVLTRATDADNSPAGEIAYGDFCFVQSGSTNVGYGYIVNTTGTITIGTTAISYVQFNAGQVVVAGNGLTETTPGTLAINTAVTVDLNTAQTLTNKTITGTFTGNLTGNVTGDVSGNAGTVTNGVYTNAANTITAASDSTKPLIIKGAVSQTADLQQWQNSSGTSVATISPNGALRAASFYGSSGLSNIAIISSNALGVNPSSASTVGFIIRGAASQSANLQEWQNSAGTVLTKVQSNGVIDTSQYLNMSTSGNAGIAVGGLYRIRMTGNNTQIEASVGNVATLIVKSAASQTADIQQWQNSSGTVLMAVNSSGAISTGTWNGTAIGATYGGTGLTSYATGDIVYASDTNTLSKLAAGTNGYLLTMVGGVPAWAAAPISLPDQTGNSGKYLTTDGTTASWATLVVPIETGTATLTANTATTISTTALSAFTSIEYMVSLKQGSKVRTSKVVLQTDGSSVDMTEFAITETGGQMTGVVISATTSGSDAVLQATVTDASSTNVTVKFSKVKL